ncbi:Transcriptional activator [Janthinobacterium lividum]|nr:Transcriptional activator [Janthinobacterium lividum]
MKLQLQHASPAVAAGRHADTPGGASACHIAAIGAGYEPQGADMLMAGGGYRQVLESCPPLFSFPIVATVASRMLQGGASPLCKLSAVVAPIGYGKTVLLSTIYQNCLHWQQPAWWFCLDDRDPSVERLLGALEARLGMPPGETPAPDPAMAVHQGGEPESERIGRLMACLRCWQSPLLLLIDNLNYCHDPAVNELLEQLVFNTPPWIRLVCSSTVALPVDMVRCKLHGLLAQYGTAELSFDLDGVRQMLGADLCTRLRPESAPAILQQTEGWPAAVRLMQILLSSSPDAEKSLAAFSGVDQDIATLLTTEVLNEFAPPLRGFLLSLSQLRDFDAHLARAATGDAHADGYLRYLWAHNVFLIPVEGEQRYRMHNLFREFLRAKAALEMPEAQRLAVLERAAQHCEKEVRCADAIDYALAAGANAHAAQILERTSAVFVRDLGYLRRYLAWIGQLRATGEYGGWEADYWYVWALVFRRRYGQAREEVARLGERLEQAGEGEQGSGRRLALVARRIEILRITLAVYTDRLEEAGHQAGRWLAMSDLEGGPCIDAPFDVATVASAAAIVNASDCRPMDARRMVRAASASIDQADSAYGEGWVAVVNALVLLREGDYVSAYNGLVDAMARARQELGQQAGIVGTMALLASKAAVEMDVPDEARKLLDCGLHQMTTHGILDTAAHGLDAAVKLWSGADAGALSLPVLRRYAAAYPPRLSLMLSCFIARRHIQLGQLDEARREAAALGIGDDLDGALGGRIQAEYGSALRDLVQATQLELLIASGKLKAASKEVSDEAARARSAGRIERLVELALDEAFLSQCMTHNAVPAARYLTRAISLAARRRHLRPFRDRGDLIAGLVNDTRLKDWPFVSEEERRFFVEICSGLKVGNPILEQIQELDGAHTLGETPTTRELELLGLIEAGLSNQEIADRLSLSVATVKWHLYNLYAKLGVKNRASALARARSLNLLQW